MKDNRLTGFILNHKTAIFWISGTLGTIGLCYAGISICQHNRAFHVRLLTNSAGNAVIPPKAELPFKEYWSSLIGEALTPKGLGREVRKSPQEINKLLISHGLQLKKPNGTYEMTELGHKFGAVADKMTKYDHPFSNIEWDKSVLNIICPENEISVV